MSNPIPTDSKDRTLKIRFGFGTASTAARPIKGKRGRKNQHLDSQPSVIVDSSIFAKQKISSGKNLLLRSRKRKKGLTYLPHPPQKNTFDTHTGFSQRKNWGKLKPSSDSPGKKGKRKLALKKNHFLAGCNSHTYDTSIHHPFAPIPHTKTKKKNQSLPSDIVCPFSKKKGWPISFPHTKYPLSEKKYYITTAPTFAQKYISALIGIQEKEGERWWGSKSRDSPIPFLKAFYAGGEGRSSFFSKPSRWIFFDVVGWGGRLDRNFKRLNFFFRGRSLP